MSQLEHQMRHRDREMVPRRLVVAMFAVMALSLALVAFAQIAGLPDRGVPSSDPPAATRAIAFVPLGTSDYAVTDAAGVTLARSTDPGAGFLAVLGRVVERERTVHRVADGGAVDLWLKTNGTFAIHDPATGETFDLSSYRGPSAAALAQLMEAR